MILVWVLCVVFVLWFAMFRYRRQRLYELAAKVRVMDESKPVVGVAPSLMGDTEDIMAALQRFSYESMDENGLKIGWLGHILYFLSVNPYDLEVILKSCLEKDDLHRFVRKITGNGGIFAPVSIWRRRRKILVPAFSPKIIENFVEVFAEQADLLASRLKECADAKPFSIWPYLSSYTLDSVCESAMGVKINAQSNLDSPFLKALNRVLNLVCERIFHLWLQADWMYQCFVNKYNEHQTCLATMHNFTDEVIEKKRKEISMRNKSIPKEKDFDLDTYHQKSFLDLLITFSGGDKGYSNVELREEILTLTVAGTDTSAVATGYTLKLLAKYPAVQERLYQELHEVFGDSDRRVLKEDLLRLSYLERVIKESMRLFPPVPFIIRKVLEEIQLPSGRTLPAGSGVVVSIWGVHRDPHYWGPDAEHFDPDRFLPERLNLPHPTCFMPFSSGPRNCVGYQYAMMSVKTAIACIIRRYKVVGEPEKGPIPYIRVKLDIMMKASDGYQVALEKRSETVA